MADVQKWAARLAVVLGQNVCNEDVQKAALLDLMRDVYVEGVQDATDKLERRKLVAMLAAASPPSSDERAREIQVDAAIHMADRIIATVK
jgi:hypothetical protein